jgi:deoxyribodipyrimidine photo-lyase
MVDASMRCLLGTGRLNFRMRALCASVYFHVLQQPWRIGTDHFFEHLIDGGPAINYDQWQSQCGMVGRPGLRLYDPRKQVRDQDPDGEFVTRRAPELDPLPATHLDAPEKTPLSGQREVGVRVGETYPYPVVDYEAARSEFRDRYGAVHGAAAARLADEEIARRASLSGGTGAARSIVADHGDPRDSGEADADRTTQADLGDFE